MQKQAFLLLLRVYAVGQGEVKLDRQQVNQNADGQTRGQEPDRTASCQNS